MNQATELSSLEQYRSNFPILRRKINGKPLIYFDNAATTQKPKQVIDAMTHFYEHSNANIHRSVHTLGEEATQLYEDAHTNAAKFIGAKHNEIVFTKNTTESLNLVAYSLMETVEAGDEIVLTEMEHHSNLVPWQQLAKQKRATINYISITKNGELDQESIKKIITPKTKIVAATHVSNVLGTINDIKHLGKVAHDNNALMVVDAAQSVPHMPVNVADLDCDFLAFSGHKMCGPTGIGVLYGKEELLKDMNPFLYGGEMIKEVTFQDTTFNDLPWKFEAGTMNIAEAVGLSAAIDYLSKIGTDTVQKHEQELVSYAMDKLAQEKDVELYGPLAEKRSGIVPFNLGKVHAHDVAAVMDKEGIALRAGHHCAMPLAEKLGVGATARASFYIYNTKQEIDTFIDSLEKVRKVFS